MTMNEAQSEAKNYLAVELGNQQRFLYEYGYSQIVDILEKGGFLCMPEEQPSNKSVLKACPFCGGEAFAHHRMNAIEDIEISCSRCACSSANFDQHGDEPDAGQKNYDDAVKAWNMRKRK